MKDFTLKDLLFLGLFVLVIYLQFCGNKQEPVRIVHEYDSTKKTPPPVPAPNGDVIIRPVFEISYPKWDSGDVGNSSGSGPVSHVDTEAIVYDWLKKRFYTRTFEDSNIRITTNDSIWKNNLFWNSVDYVWKKPIRSTEYQDPGPGISVGMFQLQGTKSESGFKIGYNNSKEWKFDIGKSVNSRMFLIEISKTFRFRRARDRL